MHVALSEIDAAQFLAGSPGILAGVIVILLYLDRTFLPILRAIGKLEIESHEVIADIGRALKVDTRALESAISEARSASGFPLAPERRARSEHEAPPESDPGSERRRKKKQREP